MEMAMVVRGHHLDEGCSVCLKRARENHSMV